MDTKSILESRTFWANVLGAAALIAGADYIPVEYRVPIMAVINILLRFVTSQPVRLI